GRSEFPDLDKQGLGGALLRKQGARRADREREEEIRTGRVAEEQLRHGEGDVALGQTEDALPVALGSIREGAVTLHHGLRLAGRAAGEQPDRGIVTVTRERLEVRGGARDRARGRRLTDDDDLLEVAASRAARRLKNR